MTKMMHIVKYLLIGIITVLVLLTVVLIFFPETVIPKLLPDSVYIEETSFNSPEQKNNVGDNIKIQSVSVREISNIFKRPATPVLEEAIQPETVEERPPEYNKTRLSFLGYITQDSKKKYFFKDAQYNDVFGISVNAPSRGFELLSVNEEEFILKKEQQLFKVKH